MKNKKLFAILTLVCFMFTLMPVAAFAAEPNTFDSEQVYVFGDALSVTTEDNTELVLATTESFVAFVGNADGTDVTTSGYVFYAVDEAGDVIEITTTGAFSVVGYPGEYEVHAIKVGAADLSGILGEIRSDNSKVEDIKEFAGARNILAGYATVTVEADEYAYMIVLEADKSAKTGSLTNSVVTPSTTGVAYTMNIKASEGWDKDGGVLVKLYQTTASAYKTAVRAGSTTAQAYRDNAANWAPVKAGLEMKVEAAGYVDVSADKLTTNNKGQASFVITSDLANRGNKVIVKFGNEAKVTLTVNATAATLANVELVNAPAAPQNNENTVEKANVEFKFTDVNGIATELAGFPGLDTPFVSSDVVITLVEKPAKSKLVSDDFKLVKQDEVPGVVAADAAGVYTLALRDGSAQKVDKDGTYTVKVALKSGASATATFKVAEMGDIVKIMFVKAPKTVAYGENTTVPFVAAGFDANGVMEAGIAAEYSASGLAVDNFDATGLLIKDDDKYIGETVTVMAVYGDFIATTDVKVVDKAATVAYLSTEAEVGVSTTLVGQIKDASGKVAPITTTVTGVNFIVLEKPENAVAVASNAVAPAYLKDGNVVMNFMASQAGEYKVQTIVTYLVGSATKYISGTETFTVGGGKTVFNDVIVMSIGANQLVKNSEVIAMPAAPEIVNSRTMVPARAGLEAFGAVVVWDEATQTVTAELGGVKVVMEIGEKVYTVNGVEKVGDAAPYITAASTMVPVSFFTNAFGIEATPIYDDHGVCDVMFAK